MFCFCYYLRFILTGKREGGFTSLIRGVECDFKWLASPQLGSFKFWRSNFSTSKWSFVTASFFKGNGLGLDSIQISFVFPDSPITKNICLNLHLYYIKIIPLWGYLVIFSSLICLAISILLLSLFIFSFSRK